ncbi:MAG: class I SAM-dependent methyltransferase [Pseudomonadota bacterium]
MQTTISDRHPHTFWDRIAQKYARKPIADPEAYEQKLARVAALLHPTDRVLEIGCGTGSTALRLAPRVAHFTATDVSRAMIDIARSKLGAEGPVNVTFDQADAQASDAGEPFDAVCAFSLLHLVNDIPALLAHVHDQLKPGGLFISKTVCAKDGSFLIRAVISLLHSLGLAPKVTYLSAEDLEEHLRNAGLEIETVAFFGSSRLNPFIIASRPKA